MSFVLRSEFSHLSWQSLVELMLSWDQGLAKGCLVETENTRMPPNLVDKGLQQDALGVGLHVHSYPKGWAHSLDKGGREKGEAAGSSGQRVLRLFLCQCVRVVSTPQLVRPGHSTRSKYNDDMWVGRSLGTKCPVV